MRREAKQKKPPYINGEQNAMEPAKLLTPISVASFIRGRYACGSALGLQKNYAFAGVLLVMHARLDPAVFPTIVAQTTRHQN